MNYKKIIIFACIIVLLSIFSFYLAKFILIPKDLEKSQVETSIVVIEQSTSVAEFETTEETKAPYISPIDFASLKEQNPDIIAWVKIPNTNIDYPILWDGSNEFYLKHDIDKKESVYGSIFLDAQSKPDFSSKHNLLYGHNMKNKSMFQNIILFKDREFFENNRDIYIYTEDKEYHLRTMACLYTDASNEKRKILFDTDEEFENYVDKMTASCKFREVPENIDRLWSLVTCSYEFNDARTILYAYEIEE